MRPIAIIVAPWTTRTPEEDALTKRVATELLAFGYCPIFLPWALQCLLDDKQPEQREAALACSQSFVYGLAQLQAIEGAPGAHLFVVGHRITEGMRRDLADWRKAGRLLTSIAYDNGHGLVIRYRGEADGLV